MPIHAPYGFVPLNSNVYRPDWGHAVSQDWPFEDGISGTIDIAITAHTPIFVRGAHDAAEFFRGPDGQPAVPGSSVRGLLRNTVEIASFGWMKRVNDHRYGVRDLQNQNLYVRHMAGIMESLVGPKLPLPKVIAGWLRKSKSTDDDAADTIVATITPCSFAKMDYREIMRAANTRGIARYSPGAKQSATAKYRAWNYDGSEDYETLDRFKIKVDVERLRPPTSADLPFDFGRVKGLGTNQGTLVFTGQPAQWNPEMPPRAGGGHPKHNDFVFYGESPAAAIKVTRSVMEGFEFVHGDGQQQHSLNLRKSRNEEWAMWGKAYDAGHAVPVFFLMRDDGRGGKTLRAFGLAMMFRLAYDHTTRDAVRAGQPTVGLDPRADLAELVFGHVPERTRRGSASLEDALKGRVSVGLARRVSGGAALPAVTSVLGSPKASYYPNYVEQDPRNPGSPPAGGKDNYKTYMDADARIRGHKRYRPQPSVMKGPELPQRRDGSVNTTVGVTFRPLPAETVFHSTIRVHNLRPVELGALLWSINFGAAPGAFHTLGMARSLGYGRVSMSVEKAALQLNSGGSKDEKTTRAEAVSAFIAAMDKHTHPVSWVASPQIQELVALAQVLPADSPHRFHMSIAAADPFRAGSKLNEFGAAKKSAESLPSVSRPVLRAQMGAPPMAGPQGGGGYGAPAAARPNTPIALPSGGGWTPIRGGELVEVELIGLNAKGKWMVKATLQGHAVSATVGQGEPPAGAEVGQRCQLVVTAGGNRQNLGFKWG